MKIPTRIAFSFLFCFIILSRSNFLAKAQNTTISVNVGVILDFDTWTGKMGLSCIKMALADFYASHNHYKTRLHLHSRDSKCDVVEAAAGALDLIKNMGVQAIIGPQNSMQANFMIDLGEKAQNFDAVVGDTTITANRSNFVDFTLPYIESEVSLVVPIRDNGSKNAWIFLKPLSWDLWITSGCFFVFTGFIVWVLEHRINEDFRGPPSHQIGTSLWYSFSTLVFAQRERVVSNLTRFVVIIWVFVVLILTQSYTASLTSLLTVQQLQPTVTDINQLIKNGEHVGYQGGSFVLGILKEMKFDENKLIIYDTPEECDQLLSKGSANGGIAGAIIETPMMKLFLGQYCSKYTMVESIYKTDGFGFVFPIGSPLVSDVSRAILNVTEGKKRKEIENAWLGNQNNCTNSNNQVSSASLTLASFWGLFLIAGVASLLSLIISMSMFLYKERQQILIHFYSEGSILRRIHHTLGIFDKKDLKSHTFRNIALQDGTGIDSVQVISASEASPNSEYTPSPSSYSTHTEPPCDCLGAFGTPPREYGDLSPNGQASQLAPVIELISYPNQEGITTIEIAHENC